MAANAHPNGAPDASTLTPEGEITITLIAEQGQVFAAEVLYRLGTELEFYPQPWNRREQLTLAVLARHVAGIEAIVDRYRPVMEQLEAQQVIDRGTAWMAALDALRDEVGEDKDAYLFGSRRVEPAPPTTGPVTVTWTLAEFEQVMKELDAEADGRDEPDKSRECVAALREQLEAAL